MVYDAWEPLGVRKITSMTRQGVFNGPLIDSLRVGQDTNSIGYNMGHHRDTKHH